MKFGMGRNFKQMRHYCFCVLHKADMMIVQTSEVWVALAPRNMWAVIFHAVVGVRKYDSSRGHFCRMWESSFGFCGDE
jgi:hypothetical protein